MTAAKSVAFHTLGCTLNFSETSHHHAGCSKGRVRRKAILTIRRTCTCDQYPLRDGQCGQGMPAASCVASSAARRRALVVITGCYAQLKPRRRSPRYPGWTLALGAAEKFNNIADHASASWPSGDSAKDLLLRYRGCEHSTVHTSVNDRTRNLPDKCRTRCGDYNSFLLHHSMARGISRSDSVSQRDGQRRDTGG